MSLVSALLVGSVAWERQAPPIIQGVRRCIQDVFSAHQSIEDDDMNVFRAGKDGIGSPSPRDRVRTFAPATPQPEYDAISWKAKEGDSVEPLFCELARTTITRRCLMGTRTMVKRYCGTPAVLQL